MTPELPDSWPAGDGEMPARIREHDWASTPLGPVPSWPASLRTAVDLTLGSPVAAVLLWGPDLIQVYNDPWRMLMRDKHPAALGAPTHACFPETEATMAPIYAQALGGKPAVLRDVRLPTVRDGDSGSARWIVHHTPVRGEAGAVAGIFCTVLERTAGVLAERGRGAAVAALRESEAQHAFLLTLSDALRVLTDEGAIASTATRLLGRHLDADRTCLTDVEADGATLLVLREHLRPGTAPVLGGHGFDRFGAAVTRDLHRGRVVALDDVSARHDLDAAARATCAAAGIAACLLVPLLRDGRLAGCLTVDHGTPRRWAEAEIALARQAADRTWTDIARARAEAALRESESRYRSIFDAIDEGFCIIELIAGEDGRAVDYRFVEVNPAFERQTGLADVVGRRGYALAPGTEPHWIEIYDGVARSGASKRFESYHAETGRWYDVHASRVARAGPPRICVVFSDVTERRRADGALRASEQRQAFLLKLSDALRAELDGGAVASRAVRMLSDQLGLDLCYTATFDLADGRAVVTHQARRGGMSPMPATLRLSDFPDAFRQALDRTLVFDDVVHAAELSEVDRHNAAALGLGALLSASLRRGPSNPVWSITAVAREPRRWTAGEVALVEEVAERTWSAIERARAEAALRESEERQRLTVSLVPALLWWADPAGRDITINDQWRSYTGQSRREVHDFDWLDAIHPDDREATRAAFAHAFATGEPLERQQRIHQARDGYRWHLVRHVPVRDGAGTIVRWFGAAIDVHELHELQDRRQVMVAELQHRTRNLITVVRSLSDRTLADAASLTDFKERFDRRLAALSRVQGLLSHLSAGKRVTFDEVLRSEIEALGAADDRAVLEGPEGVPLRSSAVQIFALALHELATNALKYGALSPSGGRLHVRWTVEPAADGGGPTLHVDWRESGVAMQSAGAPARQGGYGRELIERALPYQLKARTRYAAEPGGVHCAIAVPIPALRGEHER